MIFWVCIAAAFGLTVWSILDVINSRAERDTALEGERLANARYADLLARVEARAVYKPLTPPTPKAQTPPKRYSGPQLRRMAEQVNNAEWAGLQERPNSEILQEQANG